MPCQRPRPSFTIVHSSFQNLADNKSMTRSHTPENPAEIIRQDFRRRLEQFYSQLNLAPPYHSIEKAVQHLSNTLKTKSREFQDSLLQDNEKKLILFQKIFSLSGLAQKHQGIITHLAQSLPHEDLTQDSRIFLQHFKNSVNP